MLVSELLLCCIGLANPMENLFTAHAAAVENLHKIIERISVQYVRQQTQR